MQDVSQTNQAAVLVRWSSYLAIGIVVASCVVLAGWQFDIVFFRQPFPRLVPMNPVSAALFLSTAISFLFVAAKKKSAVQKLTGYALALVSIIVSLLNLIAIAGLSDFAIDRFLFPDKFHADIVNNLPANMVLNTAFCFMLAGGSMLDKTKQSTHTTNETVNTVRKISVHLRPGLLDDPGLVAAMEWYLNDFKQRTGIDIIFNLPKYELELTDSINTCLFRILQESLTNAARHAGAKLVTVTLKEDVERITLTIKDDGMGYDAENNSGKRTVGITGMKEIAAMIGGKYIVNGKPGEGTIVSIEVPSFQYLSKKSELI